MPQIDCAHCGATNRIDKFRIDLRPICGRCGSKLPEPSWIGAARIITKYWAWGVLAGGVGLVVWLETKPPKPRTPPKPDCAAVAIRSGVHRVYTSRAGIAPLKIVTASGADYYVKLEDTRSSHTAMTIFVRGGFSVEVKVPLGTYKMKYASGSTWCGEDLLFGKSTRYSEAQSVFNFADEGNQISGYTVQLIMQRDGNLSTKSIPASSF